MLELPFPGLIFVVVVVYPVNCTKYYGPHPVDCLVTIWHGATCLRQGYKYPKKLSTERMLEIDQWNIRYTNIFVSICFIQLTSFVLFFQGNQDGL